MSRPNINGVPGHLTPTGHEANRSIFGHPKPRTAQWRAWINLALDYADRHGLQGEERSDWIAMVTGVKVSDQ